MDFVTSNEPELQHYDYEEYMRVLEDAFIEDELLPKISKLSPSYFLKFCNTSLIERFKNMKFQNKNKIMAVITLFFTEADEHKIEFGELLETIVNFELQNEVVTKLFAKISTVQLKLNWARLREIWIEDCIPETVYYSNSFREKCNLWIRNNFRLLKPALDILREYLTNQFVAGVSIQGLAFMLFIIKVNLSKISFEEKHIFISSLTSFIMTYKGVENLNTDESEFLYLCKSMLFGRWTTPKVSAE